jgi:hypothetical protein
MPNYKKNAERICEPVPNSAVSSKNFTLRLLDTKVHKVIFL